MPVTNHTSLFGRRDFLRIGSLGALGINLAGVLRAGAKNANSCILLWLSGGPAHQDMWDLKPDAPIEYRGEFKPIPTNVAGIQICEHLPFTAKQADKFTILRSMHSRENNHERAINYLLTGYLPLSTLEFPSMGSVVAKELGPKNGLPPYVAVPNTFPSYGAGYLGGEYNPFIAGDPNVSGYRVRDITLPADVDWSRVGNRRWLLEKMDAKYRALDANVDFDALDSFQQRAYDLMRSPAAKKAFDIESEPQELREKYGRTPVGQGALLARRLVEAGVRFVTVAKGWLNYDTHGDNFNTLKKVLLPEFDQAFATLLEDLHRRGMLDSTLVIAMGEFGRTPKVNGDAGRDHHNKAWSIALAGAGIPGGRVLGATDKTASEITDFPVEPEDLLHSIYNILGVDSTREYQTPIGRPSKIVNGGKIIPNLVA
ncbi:MAG TPA: DUF1501 domain-containing protein [Bryobacteraceae bacterium]|nr:DUF1501 domain-containing protein [Bryobacteraceae bacterium]